MLKKIFANILDYIWPQFCLGCSTEGSLLCDKCHNSIKILPPNPYPWPDHDACLIPCYVCLDYSSETIKKLISTYKYGYIKSLAKPLAGTLQDMLKNLNLDDICLTNIPLHKSRRASRGFDQTELLCRELALNSSLPYSPLLKRLRRTKQQAKLSRSERLQNMTDAFALIIDSGKLKNKTIVLVDDVATTGSTLNAAAKALQKTGCNNIIGLVLAKNDV